MEVTSEPPFSGDAGEPLGKETVHKATDAAGYTVVADTRGTLGWSDGTADGRPLLILLSERAGQNYLKYLESKGISYIATGRRELTSPGQQRSFTPSSAYKDSASRAAAR